MTLASYNNNVTIPSYGQGYARNIAESAYPSLWKGLVGAWAPTLGVTGNLLLDVSGNEHHGTLTSMDAATDWVTNAQGQNLDFDGTDDTVDVSDTDWFSFGDGTTDKPFSVFASFLPRVSLNTDAIAQKWGVGGADREWILRKNAADKVQFRVFDHSAGGRLEIISGKTLTIGAHNNLTVTYDGSGIDAGLYVYIDGIEDTTATKSTSGTYTAMENLAAKLRFGIWGAGSLFDGQMGNIFLYNRVLQSDEALQLHRDPSSLFQKKASSFFIPNLQIPVAMANYRRRRVA